MEYRYLYIDDDNNAGDAVDLFSYRNENDSLIVQFQKSIANWDEQQNELDTKDYDGIMIDLDLNDQRPTNDIKAKYSGTEIAQRLRTKSLKNGCPVVLYSANNNIDFWSENKKSGLFDLCIGKDWNDKQSCAVKMYSLVKAYKTICEKETDVFGIDIDVLEKISKPFLDYLKKIKSNPTYIIAQFILNEFICKQGILIDEEVLAARLGIDKEQTSDWKHVLEKLDFAKYNGIFSEGWPRWWMFKIENWWNTESNMDEYMISTPASDRVKVVKEKFGIENITPATPLPKAESDLFWTVCKGFHKPLDPIDGLAIQGQENLFSWQETEYVSIEAALNRKNKKEWKSIADVEQYHFEKIVKYYEEKDK